MVEIDFVYLFNIIVDNSYNGNEFVAYLWLVKLELCEL